MCIVVVLVRVVVFGIDTGVVVGVVRVFVRCVLFFCCLCFWCVCMCICCLCFVAVCVCVWVEFENHVGVVVVFEFVCVL